MKTSSLLFIMILASYFATAQSVGIGTTTPGNNSVLDVTSTNKGILLPRLADTTLVFNPTAGLMIYNKKTNTPSFHDGVKWQSFLSTSNSAPQDSITYTILNSTGGFTIGTFKALQLSHNGSASGGTAFVNTLKEFDANSISFKRGLTLRVIFPEIEFKVYTPGSGTPYFSIKLKTWQIDAEAVSVSSIDGKLAESYNLLGTTIGYKDWVNNKSFAWNSSTLQEVAY